MFGLAPTVAECNVVTCVLLFSRIVELWVLSTGPDLDESGWELCVSVSDCATACMPQLALTCPRGDESRDTSRRELVTLEQGPGGLQVNNSRPGTRS